MTDAAGEATPSKGAPTGLKPFGAIAPRRGWKQRSSAAGLHLFERKSGLNLLLDEISVPRALWSPAPRQFSIALTNRCDLACDHCYAPKSSDELGYDDVMLWLAELDANGTIGIGFGGGEPTLYRGFAELCQSAAQETELSVTFTTHGHSIDLAMADQLRGSVHFIRVSMDGVGDTYESIRRRPFRELRASLKLIAGISRFGINIVVNERTLPDLDKSAAVAADSGACELLLLPQVPVRTMLGISDSTMLELRRWVDGYSGPLKLCVSEAHADAFPTCDPLVDERGLRAYAHIDATGVLKPSSYHGAGVPLGDGGVLEALDQLAHDLAEKDA
ncbi:MAG: radical SAM protein [Nannocystaceae bacterium]